MTLITRIEVGPEKAFPLGVLAAAGPHGEGSRVAESIPSIYDRYLRVFHPFLPADPDRPDEMLPGPARTWASLAAEAGVVFHAEISWYSLLPALGGWDNEKRPYWVNEGNIDEPVRSSLFGRLADATGAVPGFFYYDLAPIVRGGVPLLFRGPVDAIAEIQKLADAVVGEPVPGPEYVWAEDRSWVLNTDYDLASTYLGCGEVLAEAILTDITLEAVPVLPTTRVDDSADLINPMIPWPEKPTYGA
jgi:hypothetical protein